MVIPSIESSLLNGILLPSLQFVEPTGKTLSFTWSPLNNQRDYVISESMLNSGSFGHIWMARGLRDQSLFILKRIRIVCA